MTAKTHVRHADADRAAHAKACEAANQWAGKARELRRAGNKADASAAERRAMLFLSRVLEIERRCPPLARARKSGKPKLADL